MKALVVKTSSMGDIIHALPALTDAMRAHPGTRFDWVVEEGFAEIPAWHPAVDRVIPVALRRWRKAPLRALRAGEWSAYRKALGAERYDAVIDAQGLVKSALLVTRLAQGPRYGLDRASAREPLAARAYDHRLPVARGQHAVERVRQIFAQALGYAPPSEPGDAAIAGRFQPPSGEPYLVFLHGTTRADKHWPDEYWEALAARAAEAGWPVRVLWSNEPERARAERLARAGATVSVLPRLDLTGVAAQIAGARALVSVDTGLAHLAAALGRPNVALYGATDPALVGTYGPHQVHLKAADFPAVAQRTEPPVFAPLVPDIVWARLTGLLEAEEVS